MTCKSRSNDPPSDRTAGNVEPTDGTGPKPFASDDNVSDLDPDESGPLSLFGGSKPRVIELPHPSSPTAWNIKAMVMTSPHPPEAKLTTCHNEVIAIAKNATSNETLLWALDRVAEEIAANVELYHWCFYNSMVLLDNKLQNDGMGILLDQQAKNFTVAVRGLWILAFALEKIRHEPNKPYFECLRSRYLELSRDYFGRDLNVVGPPFGNDPVARPGKKKAAPAPADL